MRLVMVNDRFGALLAGLTSTGRIQQKRCLMIKKVAGGYKVLSENGKKNLGGPSKQKSG